MSRIKIFFIFFLGLCLVIITLLNESGRNNDIMTLQNKGLFLTWDGTQLIIVKSKNKAAALVSKNSIPTQLCPIFFSPIPLNNADKELLITLPNVGPVTAELILRKRIELGLITNREQLMSIKGVGEKTAVNIEQYTTYEL